MLSVFVSLSGSAPMPVHQVAQATQAYQAWG